MTGLTIAVVLTLVLASATCGSNSYAGERTDERAAELQHRATSNSRPNAASSTRDALHGDAPRSAEWLPRREFRAVWVATVANIDWPSKPGLDVATQQSQARAILDRALACGLNAVVFQVRPQADALYASTLEPWSAFLTGQQGRAPAPFYDPLKFWIDEAHARGLELHAWFNPYRAWHPACPGEPSAESIVRARPDCVVTLGREGYRWMNPARDDVRAHSLAVVRDVVERYEVDGIHFDDYFYPYPSYNDDKDFPDADSYDTYRRAGGKLSLHDFRRDAVNRFVKDVYACVQHAERRVRFGISPFGIWRPGHPRGIEGFDQYDRLFADPRRWLQDGDIDYLAPQLYWPIARGPQSFPVLLGWWQQQNPHERCIWPGISLRNPKEAAGARETVAQILVARGMLGERGGICIFSMKSLMNPSCVVASALQEGPYREPALVPVMPWIEMPPVPKPMVSIEKRDGSVIATWTIVRGSAARFVVYEHTAKGVRQHIVGPNATRHVVAEGVDQLAVTAVDRLGNEGPLEVHRIPL